MGHFQWHFVTDRLGNIQISFVEYLARKKVRLKPDIVEYGLGDQAPMFDLIISKLTMHDLGLKLNFHRKTITIDEIFLPMRNIVNLQLKTRALRENACFAQEPISTGSTTKRMVKILDAKYEKADLPASIRENCSHRNSQCCSNSSHFLMAH